MRELPDRLSFQSYTLVTARCREVFEKFDPDGGHVFLPASLETSEGDPIDGPWFYMWCGRIYGAHQVQNTSNITYDASGRGEHYVRNLATPDRCEFFKDMPAWTPTIGNGPSYLSERMFRALNDAGLTGFREYTTRHGFDLMSDDDTWADVITPQNVSHIWL